MRDIACVCVWSVVLVWVTLLDVDVCFHFRKLFINRVMKTKKLVGVLLLWWKQCGGEFRWVVKLCAMASEIRFVVVVYSCLFFFCHKTVVVVVVGWYVSFNCVCHVTECIENLQLAHTAIKISNVIHAPFVYRTNEMKCIVVLKSKYLDWVVVACSVRYAVLCCTTFVRMYCMYCIFFYVFVILCQQITFLFNSIPFTILHTNRSF